MDGKRKILIADDDRSWIYQLENILYSKFFYANNLADALLIIEEEQNLDAGIFDRILPAKGEGMDKLCSVENLFETTIR